MNLNELAVEIAEREGKKEEVNIAQVKEVLHCLFEILVDLNVFEFTELLQRGLDRAEGS